jgi:hypothetical protein
VNEPTSSLQSYLSICTRNFVGRDWVFREISDWLANDDTRFFLLLGEPGSGKTSIAARLREFSEGEKTAPPGAESLSCRFLSAWHFCRAQDYHLINPYSFTCFLADQLAQRFPNTFAPVANPTGSLVNVNQTIGSQQGAVTGIVYNLNINNLSQSAISPEDAFEQFVRRPLEALFAERSPDHPIVILIDGLDEAVHYRQDVNIVSLISQTAQLPSGVRFILTSNQTYEVVDALPAASRRTLSLVDETYRQQNDGDVAAYVLHTFGGQAELKARLAQDLLWPEFIDTVCQKSQRNFLYLTYQLRMLQTQKTIDGTMLASMPQGMNDVYLEQIHMLTRADRSAWRREFAPLLGTLAVSQEALTEQDLARFSGLPRVQVRELLSGALRPFVNAGPVQVARGDAAGDVPAYTIYHPSFAELLLDANASKEFWCQAAEQHLRIADVYLETYAGNWHRCDRYGLKYLAAHMTGAIDDLMQPQQHAQVERLVEAVLDRTFQHAHGHQVGDMEGLRRMLDGVLEAAAQNDAIDPTHALPSLIRMALGSLAFDESERQPPCIFDLARRGEVQAALEYLKIFPVECHWYYTAALTIVWLAARHGTSNHAREALQRVLDEIEQQLTETEATAGLLGVCQWTLLRRVRATLDQRPLRLHWREAPDEELVRNILTRLGGRRVKIDIEERCRQWMQNARVLERDILNQGDREAFVIQPVQEADQTDDLSSADRLLLESDQIEAYVLEDGEALVSFAIAHPDLGDSYFRQYLNIHATNNYRLYRNLAFGLLLRPVLNHPNDTWACRAVETLVVNVLAGREQAFQEGLPRTLSLLQAATRDEDQKEVEHRLLHLLVDAPLANEGASRSDTWCTHKRRLTAAAEALSILPDHRRHSALLIDVALGMAEGYAGYEAHAALTLAETISICTLQEQWSTEGMIERARFFAHNIHNAGYSARVTARVNAMDQLWWTSDLSASALVEEVNTFVYLPTENHLNTLVQEYPFLRLVFALAQQPDYSCFASRHVIGERYTQRIPDSSRADLPTCFTSAVALEHLSSIYQQPITDLRHANPTLHIGDAEQLPNGSLVRIHDPEFAAYMAARLAAEILVQIPADNRSRVQLIGMLVPVAERNPTMLDVVLARLLLAAHPTDEQILEQIRENVQRIMINL